MSRTGQDTARCPKNGREISTSGKNGQFRTPRHIIKLMVELTEPTPKDFICDPAAGTCGFLVAAGGYLREKHAEIFRDSKLRCHFQAAQQVATFAQWNAQQRAAVQPEQIENYKSNRYIGCRPCEKIDTIAFSPEPPLQMFRFPAAFPGSMIIFGQLPSG